MMSNFVGLLDLYRITGEDAFLRPVLIAWQDIVSKRLYLTGTATWGEHFQEDYFLRADDLDTAPGVGEGCVTTTWLQMNLHLLRLTGDSKYADELERTVYNALLASQHPSKGQICYFTPLNGIKRYGAVSQGVAGVSCCTSSIPRGLGLIPAIAWGGRKGGVAVNLYTPGTVRVPVSDIEATIISKTAFPPPEVWNWRSVCPARRASCFRCVCLPGRGVSRCKRAAKLGLANPEHILRSSAIGLMEIRFPSIWT